VVRTGRLWQAATDLANESRADLPSSYVLKLTDAACSDLGIAQPEAEALVDDQHPLVRKFVDRFKDPSAVDDGVPFRSRAGRGLYRVRMGQWRGLVWADKGAGVVWLLRAVALSDFPDEDQAYRHLAGIPDAELFPGTSEAEAAATDQVVAHALGALRDALQTAFELPGEWHEARMRPANGPAGAGESVGRAFVERELIEEEDLAVEDRFLIAVTQPPTALEATEWAALVMARVFPRGEEVFWVSHEDLPPGSGIAPGLEFALSQHDWGDPPE
jgi:hypothetical protein